MPTVQTILFENVEVDVSNNKQLFIHPIHRVVAEEFPVPLSFAVLSCAYDLPAGRYSCKHSMWTEDRKTELISFAHELISLDQAGGGMGFRTSFENIQVPGAGRYWIRTEFTGGLKADDIVLRVEGVKKGAPKLNLRA
jgi:hypothetical protein